MDIKQIRYFQAVAQYGSITEASRRLFIVQPALSRQIKELEHTLNTKLFIRRHKGIELTATGEQLLKDVPSILHALDQARHNVQRASGFSDSLHIGTAPTYTWNPLITNIIKDFQEAHPETRLTMEPTLATSQSERLTQGKLDAGFMAWRLKADMTKAGIAMMRCRLLIACARDSGLARMDIPSFEALKQEKCLLFPREMSSEFYDFLLTECRKVNFYPDILQCATDFNSCLGIASSGLGYTFISSASRHNCPDNIILIEHPALSGSYELEFVYRKGVQKPALQKLIDFVTARYPQPLEHV